MADLRNTLKRIAGNLEESMGVRVQDLRPKLSPVPLARDSGRRPLRNVGQVDINQVIPDPDQPRAEFSEEALDRLADSIRDKGQLSPIRVRWSSDLGKWVIVVGERRWRATKRAGLPTIDCIFDEAALSESEIREQQLIENLLREDLQPIEEAKAFDTLMKLNGWNGKQLADALRIQQPRITKSLALLKLPDEIQDQVELGAISASVGYELSRLPHENKEAQRQLAAQAAAGQLDRDQTARAVRQRQGRPKRESTGVSQTFFTEDGWRIVVSLNRPATYEEMELALQEALDEVRHRVANNVVL
jgi:ParB family chromosome partitioning protein